MGKSTLAAAAAIALCLAATGDGSGYFNLGLRPMVWVDYSK